MTTKRAHGYLLSVRRDVGQSASLSMTEGLRASGAGLQVVQWLKSSGKERDLSFIDNVPFTNVLLQFMVAEGLGDLAWSWLDRLLLRDSEAILTKTSPSAILLDAIVRANTEEIELDEAFSAILRGQDMFRVHEASAINLHTAWSTLAYRSTVNSWRHSKPPVDLFERFVAIRIGQPMRLERAHLNLHHPTKPDPAQAVNFLQTPSLWSQHPDQGRGHVRVQTPRRQGPPACAQLCCQADLSRIGYCRTPHGEGSGRRSPKDTWVCEPKARTVLQRPFFLPGRA